MRSKGWLAFVMLALGTGLLVAAQLAGAAPAKSDQVIRVGTPGASVQIDPQVAYITTAWWLEDATAAKLYDLSAAGMLVPQAASGFTVANRGRTYTFTIRKGFRFSDGTPVTAKSFAYAIDRVANKELASPGAQFITDPNGVNIVGAAKVNAGQAQHVSGVVPDQFQCARVVAADELDPGVLTDRIGEIGHHAVERHCHRTLGERRRDALGDFEACGVSGELARRAVGKGEGDLAGFGWLQVGHAVLESGRGRIVL